MQDNNLTLRQRDLCYILENNIWGCDLLISLFITALNSYRAHECFRPFPSLYINDEGKNFQLLRQVCDNIPSLNSIIEEPKQCPSQVMQLLEWLFLDATFPELKRISFEKIVFPSNIDEVYKPHYIFKVNYSERAEQIWQRRIIHKEVITAYHGSSVDNFYSILKFGLQQYFSVGKEGLFGDGIYLSDEISVSAHYSPFRQAWKHSKLGKSHSVIAMCEIANDPHKVKSKDSKYIGNSRIEGTIPEKYFIVDDSDFVKIKYLLVYKKNSVLSVKSYLEPRTMDYILNISSG